MGVMVQALGVFLGVLVALSIAAIVLYVALFLAAAAWVVARKPSEGYQPEGFSSSEELDGFLSALLASAKSSVGANGHG